MAIKCFSRTIPGYKQVSNRIKGHYNLPISDDDISAVIYEYAAKKGLANAEDAFLPENIAELQDYLDNHYLIDRYINLDDKEANDLYEDWYIENANDNGVVDITSYTEEQIADLNDITTNSAIIVEDNSKKYAIVPRPKKLKSITDEMQSIKDAAIKSGTFMKAPNGKLTNLTESQWLQVRTKNFKNWFGDWENDPANASKVIDENGEPMVVWHGSDTKNIKEFDLRKTGKNWEYSKKYGKNAIFFTNVAPKYWGENVYPVFLNIRKPEISHSEGFLHDSFKVKNEDTDGVVPQIHYPGYSLNPDIDYESKHGFEKSIEKAKNLLKKYNLIPKYVDFDNWSNPNVIQSYESNFKQIQFLEGLEYVGKNNWFAGEFAVFNPNQIKSAINNNGQFSTADRNIYHNTTFEGIYNRILQFVEDKKASGQKFSLVEINRHFGTNIGFNPETKEFTTKNPKIDGVSIYNPNDTKVEAKRNLDRTKLLKYLGDKFNLNIKEVSPEEYAKKAGDFSNCCVIGDTVYIKHGQNYTNEQIIEEFLHPAIHALYGANKELVENLLEEARKMFPDLAKQIEVAYKKQGKQVQDEELITQVLSKYLNKEISDNGEDSRTIVDYIKQLFDKIAELFQDLFSNANVQEGAREQISGADIREAYSFENLAKLINSKEIEFNDVLSSGEIRKNAIYSEFDKLSVDGYRRVGEKIDSIGKGKNICIGTQMVCIEDIANKFNNGDMQHNVKAWPVSMWAKSPLEDSIISHESTIVEVNGEFYLYDMPQTEFIKPTGKKFTDGGNKYNEGIIEEFIPRLIPATEDAISSAYQISGESLKDSMSDINDKIAFLKKRNSFNIIISNKSEVPSGSKEYKIDQKVDKVKPAFEQQVAAIKDSLKKIGKRVVPDKDFAKNHIYKIDGKNADVSVTSIRKFLSGEDISSTGPKPALVIGSSFDAMVRDFFSTGKLMNYYPNIQGQRNTIRKELENLKSYFDKTFKYGYEVITKEDLLRIGGYITKDGKTISVAGTMDMVIIAKNKDGDAEIYIYDAKTSRVKDLSSDNVVKYTDQVNFYKKLLGANNPELADRIKGVGLIVANTSYGENGNNSYDEYSVSNDGQTIVVDGEPIEGTKNEIKVHLRAELDKSYGQIQMLDESEYIDGGDFDFAGLTEEEKDAMEGLGQDESDVSLFEKAARKIKEDSDGEEIDFSADETYKRLSDNLPVIDESNPVGEREQIFLGKIIVRKISELADTLAKDKSFKIELFGSKENGSSYDDDYFIGKRDTLMTQEVFDRLKNYLVEESGMFDITGDEDDVMTDKLLWIRDHIDALLNSAYADLLYIENVTISTSGDVDYIDGEISAETIEAYEKAEQQVEERAAYTIDSREESYIGSMSRSFKRALTKILDYEYNEDGSVATDEDGDPIYTVDEWGYGIAKYIPLTTVVNKIYDICHGLGDSRQMMLAIKDASKDTPWLQQVYDLISNDPILKNQLFTVFRKDKNNLGKVYAQNPNDKDTPVIPYPFDSTEKVKKVMQGVNSVINSDKLALIRKEKNGLFTIDADYLEEISDVDRKHKGAFAKLATATTRKEKVRALKNVLEILGFDYIPGVNTLSNRDSKNVLQASIEAIISGKKGSIFNILKRLANSGKSFSFQKELTNAYKNLVNALSPVIDEEVELTAYDNKKNYSIYSEPTAMQTIVDRLAGRATVPYLDNGEVPSKQELYQKLFEEKYDNPNYWQFGYGEGSDRTYFAGWVKALKDNNNGEREIFKHFANTSVQLSSKAKEYLKQNGLEYSIGVLMEFAAPSYTINGKRNYFVAGGRRDVAKFRCPTMSDKPANEFVQFLKKSININDSDNNYGIDAMKHAIADEAFEYVRFEIRRFKELVAQLQHGNSADDVEFFSIPRTSEYKSLADGGKITLAHLVKDGKLLADKKGLTSGLKFEFLPMLNDELIANSEYGQKIIDAINGEEDELEALRDGFFKIFDTALTAETAKFQLFLKQNGGYKIIRNSIDEITDDDEVDAFVTEFMWNDALAAMNLFNLTVIDPAFHKNSSDLQKRYAEFHASTQRPNLLAEFIDKDGKTRRVSDGRLRYVVLEDAYADSNLGDTVTQIFLDAAKESTNKARAAELKAIAARVKKDFKEIILTDGQAFGSPTGFWKKLEMLGENNPDLFDALQRIKTAGPSEITLRDIDICIQAFKPFVFSQREQNHGDAKTLVPTQIKDSEAMIYLAGAIMKSAGKNGILPTLYEIMENSHYGGDMVNGSYSDHGIDMFVFHSAVKTGASRIVDLSKINPEDMKSYLEELLYRPDGSYSEYVQSVSFEDWGKQQEVPSHNEDMEQGMPSQGRVLSVSDLVDTNDFKIKGVDGFVSRKEFLDRYFDLHDQVFKEKMILAGKKLGIDISINPHTKNLEISGKNALEFRKKLSEILINNIAKDTRYSAELRKAFTLVNGKFVVPIGDPSLGDKVYGAVLSLLKKSINDEKFLGGPIVIKSSVGFDDNLHFFKDKDDGWTAEVYATFPSSEIRDAMTYSHKRHKKLGLKGYVDGQIISVEDGLKYGLITEDDIIGIADRIPTENKYSQIRYRIKEFLPRLSGEFMVFPKEKTMLGGDDFDIDKVYPRRKYKIDYNLYDKVSRGEMDIKEMESIIKIQELENEIFDMQWQALGHKSSQTKLFKKGSFETLKDIASEINDDFGHENHPLIYFNSQRFYQEANSAGKQFVGIAALNNTAHAFCEIAGTGFKEFPSFKIGGIHSDALFDKESGVYKFDAMYSPFDGSLISDSVCMFVGASADNAKDAVLGALNTNPTTGNVFMGLLRMGIPLRTAIYMMNMPIIKDITKEAQYSNNRFEDILLKFDVKKLRDVADDFYESFDGITDEDMLRRIKDKDGDIQDIDIAVVQLLQNLVPYCNLIRAVTDRTAVNSTKNAAHKNGYDAMQRKLKAEEFAKGMFDNSELLNDTALNINKEIPFLGTLSYINEELIPAIFGDITPLFSSEFKNDNGSGVLDKFMAAGVKAGQLTEKEISKIYNAWLVFKATKVGAIDASRSKRKHRIYSYPVGNFFEMQKNMPTNTFIQNLDIKKMNYKYPIQSVAFSGSKFTREMKDDISAALGDLSRQKSMRPYLDDFMDYMISRFGFTYSPQSSMSITPNCEKIRYKGGAYFDIFNTIYSGAELESSVENFLIQYARNNIYSPLWTEVDKDAVSISGTTMKVPPAINDFVSPIGIRIGRKLFVKAKKVNPKAKEYDEDGNYIYTQIFRLGVDNQFLEYDANEDGYEMDTVITSSNNNAQRDAYSALFTELENDDMESEADNSDELPDSPDGDYDDSTEFVKFEWFEIVRQQDDFKSLIQKLGISDSYFNLESEPALTSAIKKVVKKGNALGDSTYKQVLEKLNDELCR